jgi:hypothetical protein
MTEWHWSTITDAVERMIDEAFERGKSEGWRDGHAAALQKVANFVDSSAGAPALTLTNSAAMAAPSSEQTPLSADPEPREPPEPAEPTEPPEEESLSPHIQRAVDYLRANPGASPATASAALQNRNVLYKLVKLGLAEKRGGAYYLADSARG